ncbi:MAG: tetratricopeptide repeat protein [Pirellulales bacterium]
MPRWGSTKAQLVDLNFALRLQPTHAEAFAYRGYALMSLGQVAKALPDLDFALRLDPSYARVHFLRGQAMEMLGNAHESASSIALARRLDPTLDISQVVTASADGSLGTSGVQLAGGSTPQRTPVMSELMPAPKVETPTDPGYVGRLVPFEQHPVLADVAPPKISQSSGDRHAGQAHGRPVADHRSNGHRHGGNSVAHAPKPVSPPAATLPDLTSDPKELLAEDVSPSAKSTAKTGPKPDQEKTSAEQPIATTMPAKDKPAIVVDAVPQAVESEPAAGVAKTDGTETEKIDDSEKLEGKPFPSFGPQIFVMPNDALASDEAPPSRPASEILRGAAEAELMLPAKPSSVDSDRRLQAAVDAARVSAVGNSSTAAMAMVGDEEEQAEVAAKSEPTPEQLETAKAAYRRGTELEAAGKTAEALAAYEEAAKLNPTDAEAHCRRGHLFLEGMRTAEALAEFEKAVACAPGLANGYFGRAHVRYVTEQYVEAQFDYSICLRLDDQHAQALIERGHCFAQLGKLAEARADRRAALDLDPSLAKNGPKYAMDVTEAKIPTAVMPGATAFAGDAGNDETKVLPVTDARAAEAAVIVSDAEPVAIDAKQPAPAAGQSALDDLFDNSGAGEKPTAEDSQKQAEADVGKLTEELSQFPGDKDRYFRRARRYCDLRRHQDAVDDLTTVLRFDAGCLEALTLRAEQFTQLGNAGAASKDYSAALQQLPDDVKLLMARSTALAEAGDVRAALADLDRVLELEPKNAAAFLERSRLHAERGAFTEAQADRDQALNIETQRR